MGRLLCLTITRPDICFAMKNLSQFLSHPRQPHDDAAIRVLKYLKGTPGQGIFLSNSLSVQLKAVCDSD